MIILIIKAINSDRIIVCQIIIIIISVIIIIILTATIITIWEIIIIISTTIIISITNEIWAASPNPAFNFHFIFPHNNRNMGRKF